MEARVRQLESLLARALQQIEGLKSRLAAAEQLANKLSGGYLPPSGGEATRLHWCRTPGAVAAASGTWPGYTPTTFTADVYRGPGALTLVASGATIYWRYKDAAAAGKLVPCVPNGDGTYDAVADSCTVV